MDWQVLEGIGGIATAVAVFVALAFGAAQMREANRMRHQAIINDVAGDFTTPEHLDALDRLYRSPDTSGPEAFADDPGLRRAFLTIDISVEAVGVLVFERVIDLHTADRWMGGLVQVGWRKARPYVEAERHRLGDPSLGEWWQWLAERIEEDPAPGKALGAHVAFRSWRRTGRGRRRSPTPMTAPGGTGGGASPPLP